MNVQPLIEIMQATGLFELKLPPQENGAQVTLIGRVKSDKDITYRWGSLMRNVLIACGHNPGIIDFSRYYHLVRYPIKTAMGMKADVQLKWNWRIVATEPAIPILMAECRSVAVTQRARIQAENAMASLAAGGEYRVPAALPSSPDATITALTAGGMRSRD
jgi:hypothetical protein